MLELKERRTCMKVKIGNKIFDSNIEPIMLILNSEEKVLISNMGDQDKFCSFPDNISEEDIIEFMK